jgi:hypothetical protein
MKFHTAVRNDHTHNFSMNYRELARCTLTTDVYQWPKWGDNFLELLDGGGGGSSGSIIINSFIISDSLF